MINYLPNKIKEVLPLEKRLKELRFFLHCVIHRWKDTLFEISSNSCPCHIRKAISSPLNSSTKTPFPTKRQICLLTYVNGRRRGGGGGFLQCKPLPLPLLCCCSSGGAHNVLPLLLLLLPRWGQLSFSPSTQILNLFSRGKGERKREEMNVFSVLFPLFAKPSGDRHFQENIFCVCARDLFFVGSADFFL